MYQTWKRNAELKRLARSNPCDGFEVIKHALQTGGTVRHQAGKPTIAIDGEGNSQIVGYTPARYNWPVRYNWPLLVLTLVTLLFLVIKAIL